MKTSQYPLTDQQHATVLAALRLMQARMDGHGHPGVTLDDILDIYVRGEGYEPLDMEGLEALIDSLLFDEGGEAPLPDPDDPSTAAEDLAVLEKVAEILKEPPVERMGYYRDGKTGEWKENGPGMGWCRKCGAKIRFCKCPDEKEQQQPS